ncbi:MAG: FG-GAP-like repeat-containing protein [Blastocatellales bacterium]
MTARAQVRDRATSRINLSDGRDVVTDYAGSEELVRILKLNQAQPLALAAADFDEDGMPDLIMGYAARGSGIVSLLRGNVDAIYPNSPEAQARRADGAFTDAPFLSPARIFAVPQSPDFIGVGDFDGDGHQDIASATRGGNSLWLLSGNGQGGFAAPRAISLPGAVSAFVTGEINHRDGLEDIAVGIDSAAGSHVLVYEGPTGALRASPEAFTLPVPATALVLGQLDSDSERDLAAAAGHNLVLIHGRDRKLSLGDRERGAVPRARVSVRSLFFGIRAMTNGSTPASLVLLSEDGAIRNLDSVEAKPYTLTPAQTATALSRASGGIIALDEIGHGIHLLAGRDGASFDSEAAPVAVLAMRLNSHAGDSLVLLQSGSSAPTILKARAEMTFTVNSTDDQNDGTCDAAHCSLREAILAANANQGLDQIAFDIQTRRVTGTQFKSLSAETRMAPGRPSSPFIIRLLSQLPLITDPVTIDGTTQSRFAGTPLIQILGGGLSVSQGDCTIRGLVVGGISLFPTAFTGSRENDIIEGNFIGTNASGTAVGEKTGLFETGISIRRMSKTLIGGASLSARNLITEILIDGSFDIVVEGNYIGTDVSGSRALGQTSGLGTRGDPANRTSGLRVHRNLISGNEIGIVFGYSADFLITGNLIGTDASGAGAVPNGTGLQFVTANGTIGGTTPSSRNVISGNLNQGIRIARGSFALVQGNYIGVSASGAAALPNGTGVEVNFNATIGGSIVEARNVISGNRSDGIGVLNGWAAIKGNFIGTDATGTIPIPNNGNGVILSAMQLPSSSFIGGAGQNEGNLISANGENGIAIGPLRTYVDEKQMLVTTFGGVSVTLQGNSIGTDVTGEQPLGNQGNGILFDNSTSQSLIIRNRVAFNNGSGIFIPNRGSAPGPPGAQITISENSIFSNSSIGIDLGEPGRTPNQPPPPVNTQANDGQNFPEIQRVISDGAQTEVVGTFFGRPNQTVTLEFFNNPGTATSGAAFAGQSACRPEGKSFQHSETVTTDDNGNAPFRIVYPKSTLGGFINATAISANGNTSEFSDCVQAEATDLSVTVVAAGGGTSGPDEAAFSVKVTNGGPSAAKNVRISGLAPNFTSFKAFEKTPAGWECGAMPVDGVLSISCAKPEMAADAARMDEFLISFRINPNTPQGSAIRFEVNVSAETFDPNPANNTSAAETKTGALSVDLAITRGESLPPAVFEDEDLAYSVTVINAGPSDARDVEFTGATPNRTLFKALAVSTGNWACRTPSVGAAGGMSCSLPSLARGAEAVFTLMVRVVPGTIPQDIAFIPRIGSGFNPDPDSRNNSISITTKVIARPPGPLLQEITVLSDSISAIGIGFASPMQILVDGVGFVDAPSVAPDGRSVTQRGRLVNGKSIAEAIPAGRTVVIQFRNPDGGRITVQFRK